jgi:hypothetical protein
MALLLRAGLSALSSLGLFLIALLSPVKEDAAPPDLGVVHADGDEAWVDLGTDLASTWKVTLATLAERGHPVDPALSYVESNGQIAIDGLWIAVVPRASRGAAVTRVRMVALDSETPGVSRTELLVRAGVLLGVIAERVAISNGFFAAPPAALEVPTAEATSVGYDTYNTYNTYTYGPSVVTTPVYVYPS